MVLLAVSQRASIPQGSLLSILLLPGLAGIFLPVPGLLYMLIVATIYAWIGGFSALGWSELAWLAAIVIISTIIDALAGILGAKYGGAKKQSIYAGIIGLLVGIFLLPPFGGLLGMFLGVLVWEIYTKSGRRQALRAASTSLLGGVAGMIISLLLSVLFIILFVVFSGKG